MNQIKLKTAATIFGLVGFLHFLRLAFQVPVTFGSWIAPMWLSVLGAGAGLGLAVWMVRE